MPDGYAPMSDEVLTRLAEVVSRAIGATEVLAPDYLVARALIDHLRTNPGDAAAALGIEHGVETRLNTDRDAAAEQRDVLRYPWTEYLSA